jgi:O-antigen/teichoic acid export membrane protein
MVACVTLPICVGILFVAPDLVSVVLSEKWAPTAPILQVLSICGMVRSLASLLPPVLFARYRATFLCWWMATVVLIMPVAFSVGATARGAVGVALAWVIVYPWLTVWMAQEAMKEIGLEWSMLWEQLKPLVLPIAVMVGCILLAQGVLGGSAFQERVLRLVISVAGSGVAYGLTIYWRGGRMLYEILEVVGWLIKPQRVASAEK